MARQETVRAPKAARDIFAEFKDDPDPEVRQRASNWSLAIGLQDVDLLSVSQFLIDTAKRNIRGEYHSIGGRRKGHCGKSNIPETPT